MQFEVVSRYSNLIRERLMFSSDVVSMLVCNGCGHFAYNNW